MEISSILIKIDKVSDWIPFVSTASNLFILFLRSLPPCCLPNMVTKNRFWQHLKNKRMDIFLFIPIANISYCSVMTMGILPLNRLNMEPHPLMEIDQRLRNLSEDIRQWRIETEQETVRLKGDLSEVVQRRTEIEQQTLRLEDDLCEVVEERWNLIHENFPQLPLPSIAPLLRKGTEEQRSFWYACSCGQIEEVRSLLDGGLNPNFYHCGSTPLLKACAYGHSAIVSLLLERGADLNQTTIFGISPVAFACAKGRLDVIQSFFPNQDLVLC